MQMDTLHSSHVAELATTLAVPSIAQAKYTGCSSWIDWQANPFLYVPYIYSGKIYYDMFRLDDTDVDIIYPNG